MLNNPGTKQRTLIIIFIYLFTALSILAQKPVQDSVSGRQRDTVNFKLKFFSGDTLTYIVKSHDSIIIDFGKPLIKSRTERIKIVCDSINKEGNFFLTQTLIEFSSVESQGETQNIENNSSPWLNRKAGLEIDSVGNRIKCVVFDSINGAMSPGGAFQPYLFFPFNVTQKAVKESWIVTSVDELVENGLPVPLLRQSSLFRAKGLIDTLDDNCARFEFIKTAQGSIPVVTENENFKVTNVINGFGIMDISTTRNVPVHFFSSVEQKLTLHFPDDVTKPGLHYINSFFTLESIQHRKNSNNSKKNKKVK